ncbi:hypothetical protein HK105_200924 [Polyrhizophydium stewartii]|uniref:AB hydrolase-1 domain-containing protein n=1 Tax=Polyrhizophydium stewartii TaxID=2732419 RepID=A0ABR4NIC5_9FUNG|nr:hypothetical protein HK105_004751 [Polyrhizophydium stewartii]
MIGTILVFLAVYAAIMAALLLRPYPIQNFAIYLHWLNFPFVNFKEGGERFGYRSGNVRTVYIKTSDGATLGAWHLLPRKAAPAPAPGMSAVDDSDQRADALLATAGRVYLYFHGNAGNRATFHRNDFYKMMTSFGTDSHVLAIDYRGFGDSSSAVPTEQGLALDAIAAYEWLIARGVPPQKIVLVGHSLGTGVATDLAFHLTNRIKSPSPQLFGGLILLSGYASICDAALGYPMVPVLLPFRGFDALENFIKSKMIDKWDSAHKIGMIRAPILIIHGKRDFEIQPWQGRALFLEAAGGRLGQKLVEDGGYWQLRLSTSKFSPRELDGIVVTDLGQNDGEIWSVDVPSPSAGPAASAAPTPAAHGRPMPPVWLLQVTHGGHNTLSKFQVVADTIESWNRACIEGDPRVA